MKTLVMTALEGELGALPEKLGARPLQGGPRGVRSFSGGYMACSGVGKRRTLSFLDNFIRSGLSMDRLIVAGYAGALHASLKGGDLVVAESVTAAPGGGPVLKASYRETIAPLAEGGSRVWIVRGVTSDTLCGQEEKGSLAEWGEFVDMESYHALLWAEDNGIEASVVKAVSDPLGMVFPPPEIWLIPWKRLSWGGLAKASLKNRSVLFDLLSFRRNLRRATLSLEGALESILT